MTTEMSRTQNLTKLAKGTRFDPAARPGQPFTHRCEHPESGGKHLTEIEYVELPKAKAIIAGAALRDAMGDYESTPDMKYVEAVYFDVLRRSRDVLSDDDYDALETAFWIIQQLAAEYVARRWIAQRGSWPVSLAEEEPVKGHFPA